MPTAKNLPDGSAIENKSPMLFTIADPSDGKLYKVPVSLFPALLGGIVDVTVPNPEVPTLRFWKNEEDYIELTINSNTSGGGGGAWGTITGDIASQTDLYNALGSKADKSIQITINGATYDLSANRSWTIPVPDVSTKVDKGLTLTINGQSFDLSENRSWTITTGAPTWGAIGGAMNDQADLKAALDALSARIDSNTQILSGYSTNFSQTII